jgi:hypothetical protein
VSSDPALLDAFRKQCRTVGPALAFLVWFDQEGVDNNDLLDIVKDVDPLPAKTQALRDENFDLHAEIADLRDRLRRYETQQLTQLAHVVAPVDLSLPKRGGPGLTACGEPLDGDGIMMATTPAAISCPICAAAYAEDPSLLGPW